MWQLAHIQQWPNEVATHLISLTDQPWVKRAMFKRLGFQSFIMYSTILINFCNLTILIKRGKKSNLTKRTNHPFSFVQIPEKPSNLFQIHDFHKADWRRWHQRSMDAYGPPFLIKLGWRSICTKNTQQSKGPRTPALQRRKGCPITIDILAMHLLVCLRFVLLIIDAGFRAPFRVYRGSLCKKISPAILGKMKCSEFF